MIGKSLILLVSLVGIGIHANQAQNKEAAFLSGHKELYSHVSKNLRYPSAVRNECESICTFAKFRVSKEGKIDSVYVSYGTAPAVHEELNRVFKLTNGKWKPQMKNGKAVESSNSRQVINL